MHGSSTRTWIFPTPERLDALGVAITEPSGTGPFAEAMRELIAQLSPVPQRLRDAQAEPLVSECPPQQAHPRATVLCSRADPRASARGHLRLVR